jgi:hypothetical protein
VSDRMTLLPCIKDDWIIGIVLDVQRGHEGSFAIVLVHKSNGDWYKDEAISASFNFLVQQNGSAKTPDKKDIVVCCDNFARQDGYRSYHLMNFGRLHETNPETRLSDAERQEMYQDYLAHLKP